MFLLLFLSIVFSANIVLFFHLRALFVKKRQSSIIIAIIIIASICSFIVGRFFAGTHYLFFSKILMTFGSFYIAFSSYLFLCAVFCEISVFLYCKIFTRQKDHIRTFRIRLSLALYTLAVCAIAAGYINTFFPVTTTYNVTIDKKFTQNNLHIVMVSDIHLGDTINAKKIETLVKKVSEISPDIFIIAGDLFDRSLNNFDNNKIIQLFKQINPRYGKYFALGNHDYFYNGDKAESIASSLGFTVLRDRYAIINNALIIAGREDIGMSHHSNHERKKLSDILTGTDKKLPLVLIDHQPLELSDAVDNNVDIQLSGHTHNGQLFPFQLVTNILYEISHGILIRNSTHIIVSSGYGTWGPPVRTSGRTEIVLINVTFTGK